MSNLWALLKRTLSKRKAHGQRPLQEPSSSGDGTAAENLDGQVTSSTNGRQLDPSWEPLTREEILADLTVEYEDAAEDEVEPEVNKAQHDKWALQSGEVVDRPSHLIAGHISSAAASEPVLTSQVEAAAYSDVLPIPTARIYLPHRASAPIDDNDRDVDNLEAGSDSVKRSYMSIIPTTIQVLNEKTTLFVWAANFHPAIGRRFSSVIISVKFSPAPDKVQPEQASKTRQALRSAHPSVIAHAPHKSFGAVSSEQKTIAWGLQLPISVPTGPVSVGVTPSGQLQTQKDVQHAFTITGSARGTPSRHACVWTVEENSSTERGIPSELQVAALVRYTGGPIMMEIDITGRTAGGFLPSHDLRPKTTAMGRKKVVDPFKFKNLLYEYNLGDGDPVAASMQMFDRWTGKVDGAVLEFDQPVARA